MKYVNGGRTGLVTFCAETARRWTEELSVPIAVCTVLDS